MKEVAPSFQWYPKDYLSSSVVIRMSLAQEGAYRRLLDYQWMDGSIPSDLADLAALCRVNAREMEKLWPGIAPCFVGLPQQPGRLVNLRLEHERSQQQRRKAERSASGKRGAARRWADVRNEALNRGGDNGSNTPVTITQPSSSSAGADGSAIAQPSRPVIATDSIAFAFATASAVKGDISLSSTFEDGCPRTGEAAASLGVAFDRMFNRHPRPGGEVFANRAYFEEVRQGRIRPDGEPRRAGIKTSLTVSEVLANFEAYLVCAEWKAGFAPHFAKWIESGLYLRKPPSQSAQTMPAGTTDEHRRRDNDLDQLMGLG